MNNFIYDILFFVLPIVLVFTFSLFYLIFEFYDEYKIKKITHTDFYISNVNEELDQLIRMSIHKVNGWSRISAGYILLHYNLNLFSLIYSFMNVFFAYYQCKAFNLAATGLASFSLIIYLFLRCDRKWATYRNVCTEGKTTTNDFLSNLQNTEKNELNDFVKKYANSILETEKKLKDSDIC